MDEKKNIDRLFQEKFKDYEVSPDPSTWKNIEGRLTKKKKRRILPLWLRIGGAAAILLLLISTGFWINNQNPDTIEQPNKIIITEIDQPDETKQKTLPVKEDNIITYKDPETNQEEKTINETIQPKNFKTKTNNIADTFISNESKNKNSSQDQIANSSIKKEVKKSKIEKLNYTSTDEIVDVTKEKSNTEKTLIAQEETIIKQETIKTDIQKEIEKREEKTIAENIINKWSVGSTMAPVFYNTLGDGSPIDPALANNKKNGEGSISYGLKVNYKLSDKFSLQSGINTLELGYSTENVAALLSSSLLAGSNTNINTNIDGVSVAAISTASSQNSDISGQRSSFDTSGNLDQSFGYIEIPLEAKYNILQKKLGVNLIGGFSTYFLYENKVSITSFGKTIVRGEATNINSMNFSGNLGVDFDYDISKKLYINVSPMFKYQFNTFSKNSGGFKAYYLGVYTGLNFRF